LGQMQPPGRLEETCPGRWSPERCGLDRCPSGCGSRLGSDSPIIICNKYRLSNDIGLEYHANLDK
jgi:hypothetical protein